MSTRTDTLFPVPTLFRSLLVARQAHGETETVLTDADAGMQHHAVADMGMADSDVGADEAIAANGAALADRGVDPDDGRSEEHTSELQSLMRISYAAFCLKKKKQQTNDAIHTTTIRH